ncbi:MULTISPECIES: LysR family transcriptional regulator [unclassified Caulobacter]|jgi:DNA-binding transcriptional LysR family regulator|uniref:LysR family transcriptional regulator n=1 Tax=unclassified Caulobacter TaxID=2648921 RepID=UPI000782E5D1|nr:MULTISPECIES: LysR family transcriptional regulator [unclassified Caulobacter]AZS22100.1 LysR family transcriptional regulator [Caulobacter sp. FWC26]
MDLADLAVFVEAAQAGSLAAAGRRLGVSPMAASRRLAALEAELSVRLVHRTTRSLSLTPEGEALLPHAQAMLEQEAEGRAAVRPAKAGASGLLRITASVPFGRKIVTPMMASFLRDNPDLRAELLLTDGIVDIAAQGIDLALRIGPMRDSTLVARRLADNPRGLYASPGYLERRGTPEIMTDLAAHECLLLPGMTQWTFERGGKPVQQRVSGRFVADSFEALQQAAIEGLGIVRLSAWNVQDDLASHRLIEITPSDVVIPTQSVWGVYPTTRFVPAKVRLFVEAFQAHLRAQKKL